MYKCYLVHHFHLFLRNHRELHLLSLDVLPEVPKKSWKITKGSEIYWSRTREFVPRTRPHRVSSTQNQSVAGKYQPGLRVESIPAENPRIYSSIFRNLLRKPDIKVNTVLSLGIKAAVCLKTDP